MTILGPDISSYQAGLDLSRLAQAAFVIAKTTEGTYYTDADFQGWRRQAASLGKPFVWYHFLSGEDPHAQAKHTAANVGDPGLPGMLDAEPAGSFSPTLAQMIAYVDAAHAAGLNLCLLYLPRWYWQQIGSPSLLPFASRGVALVSSSYPGGSGGPAALYPGDGAAGWQSYGGMTPLIYQFTNQASDGGQLLDYNAHRGTVAELTSALAAAPTTSTNGGSMPSVIPDSIAHHFPGLDLSADFPAGAPFDPATAGIWADARAEAACRYAQLACQKVDQVLAHLATPPAPAPVTVDVDALAAALAPHLTAGATADQLAHAVVMHLAADLQAG